jgi:ribose 5-phosphate isomerase A
MAHPATSTISTLPVLAPLEAAKRLAAYAAVDRHIGLSDKVRCSALPSDCFSGFASWSLCAYLRTQLTAQVIGIGSGSTVPYVVDRIVAQGAEANLGRIFVPTGFQSKELIIKGGLVLGDIDQYPSLDVTIDGADEYVSPGV